MSVAEDTEPSPALRVCLNAAVPMWMLRYRDTPDAFLYRRAEECGYEVASKGDVLIFGGKQKATKVACRETFNRLAEALAIMALLAGEVEFWGMRFRR